MKRMVAMTLTLLLILSVFFMAGCQNQPQDPSGADTSGTGGIQNTSTSPTATQTSPTEPNTEPSQPETEPTEPSVAEPVSNLITDIIGEWRCYETRGSSIPLCTIEFFEDSTFIQTVGEETLLGQYVVPACDEGILTLSYGYSYENEEETILNYYAWFDGEKLLLTEDLNSNKKYYAIFSHQYQWGTNTSDQKLANDIVGSWTNTSDYDGYMTIDTFTFWDNGSCTGGYTEYELIDGVWEAFGGIGWSGTYAIRDGLVYIYEQFEQQFGPSSANTRILKIQVSGNTLTQSSTWGDSIYTKEDHIGEPPSEITNINNILGTWEFTYSYYDNQPEYLTMVFNNDGTCQLVGTNGSFSGRYSLMSGRLLLVLDTDNGPLVLVRYLTYYLNDMCIRHYYSTEDGTYENAYEYARQA